ncbi:MAG: hypothetical protein HUK40_18385 [Desulfobacter sp.]|nr:hypothetical protein [Desulfobacter sp.]
MNTKTCPDPPGCRNSFKFKNTLIGLLALLCLLLAIPAQIRAENLIKEDTKADDKTSPWLFTPVLSSNPKLSTAGGGMAAYMYQFDEHSPASIMGGTATYSTTDSYYYGIFAKLHFGRDDHRLLGGIGKGKVRNNYDDFLGSGLPVQTTDDLDVLALRYYKRIKGNWYLGPQGISTNYAISGDNWLSGKIIELIGMTGFKSNGLGLALQYDSRDNQNSPSSGQVFQLHNIA